MHITDKQGWLKNSFPTVNFYFFQVRFPYFLILFFLLFSQNLAAQTVNVNQNSLQDYFRRLQLAGKLDSNLSFNVRPIYPYIVDSSPNFSSDSLQIMGRKITVSKSKILGVTILPIQWDQQYITNPYNTFNDGSIIPAKGYQSRLSAGVFAKLGFVSIQLQPEVIFAENREFKEFKTYYGSADIQNRFGTKSYSKLLPGQSSIRLNFSSISVGLSSENIWWGPGVYNALIMSNNASGFTHLTLNTTKPINTPVGSFEGQIIGGRLEASGFKNTLPDDWRYLSGINMSYQPRWIPGWFIGLTRSFQMYSDDMDDSFGDYFPFLQAFQKVKTKEDDKRRDQVTSIYSRILIPRAKAEIYMEYGLNDHSYNIRDFLMAPEHSRAYTVGVRKLIPFRHLSEEYIQVGAELTHMEQSIDRTVRDAGEWYMHSQVLHGYTNRGEVLGAGIGPGSNFQSLNVAWVRGIKQIGIQLERYEHNADLANSAKYQSWVDFGIGANSILIYKNILFNTRIKGIQSVNYQWSSGLNGRPKKDLFSINANLGVTYIF